MWPGVRNMVVEGMWDDMSTSWWYDKVESSFDGRGSGNVCGEVVWQVYVYILLKVNRYDDGMEAVVKPSKGHATSMRWGLLVVRNTPRIAKRRMDPTHMRQASRRKHHPCRWSECHW